MKRDIIFLMSMCWFGVRASNFEGVENFKRPRPYQEEDVNSKRRCMKSVRNPKQIERRQQRFAVLEKNILNKIEDSNQLARETQKKDDTENNNQ